MKTKEEQIDFCFNILQHLSDKPQQVRLVAENMGISLTKLRYPIDLLSRAGLIFSQFKKGIYRDVGIPLDKDYVTKELAYIFKRRKPEKKKRPYALGPEIVVNPISSRRCRECKQYLPASRYFKCIECQPELSSIQEDFVYVTEQFKWEEQEIPIFGYTIDDERFESDYKTEKYGYKKEENSEE